MRLTDIEISEMQRESDSYCYPCKKDDDCTDQCKQLRERASLVEDLERLCVVTQYLIDAAQETLKLSAYPPHSVSSKMANDETLHRIHKASGVLRGFKDK